MRLTHRDISFVGFGFFLSALSTGQASTNGAAALALVAAALWLADVYRSERKEREDKQ